MEEKGKITATGMGIRRFGKTHSRVNVDSDMEIPAWGWYGTDAIRPTLVTSRRAFHSPRNRYRTPCVCTSLYRFDDGEPYKDRARGLETHE